MGVARGTDQGVRANECAGLGQHRTQLVTVQPPERRLASSAHLSRVSHAKSPTT